MLHSHPQKDLFVIKPLFPIVERVCWSHFFRYFIVICLKNVVSFISCRLQRVDFLSFKSFCRGRKKSKPIGSTSEEYSGRWNVSHCNCFCSSNVSFSPSVRYRGEKRYFFDLRKSPVFLEFKSLQMS